MPLLKVYEAADRPAVATALAIRRCEIKGVTLMPQAIERPGQHNESIKLFPPQPVVTNPGASSTPQPHALTHLPQPLKARDMMVPWCVF